MYACLLGPIPNLEELSQCLLRHAYNYYAHNTHGRAYVDRSNLLGQEKKILVSRARPHLLLANASFFFFLFIHASYLRHMAMNPAPFGRGLHSLFNANSVVVGHRKPR